MNERITISSYSSKRPAGIISLVILFCLVSLYHLFKFCQVILNWSILAELNMRVSPYYLAGDGLAWFVIALRLAWALWNTKYWAGSVSQIASILYCLEFWIDKIWISYPDGVPRSWPFNLLITILGLVLVLGILNHFSIRDYFDGNPAKIT